MVSQAILKMVSRAVGQAGTYFETRDTGMGSQGRYVDGNWGKRDAVVGQAVGIGKGQSQLNVSDLTGSFSDIFIDRR